MRDALTVMPVLAAKILCGLMYLNGIFVHNNLTFHFFYLWLAFRFVSCSLTKAMLSSRAPLKPLRIGTCSCFGHPWSSHVTKFESIQREQMAKGNGRFTHTGKDFRRFEFSGGFFRPYKFTPGDRQWQFSIATWKVDTEDRTREALVHYLRVACGWPPPTRNRKERYTHMHAMCHAKPSSEWIILLLLSIMSDECSKMNRCGSNEFISVAHTHTLSEKRPSDFSLRDSTTSMGRLVCAHIVRE